MYSYNPWKDNKFRAAAIDGLVFLVLYFAGKYAPASIFDDIKTVFATVQPLVLLYVANLFMTETALLRAGNPPNFLNVKRIDTIAKWAQPK